MMSYQITIAIIIVSKVQIDGQETNCGRRLVNHTSLITNGFESNVGDWPWHSAIYHANIYSFTYKCGGTVLSSNAILTAAHCIFENDDPIIPDRVLVYLAKHNLKNIGTFTKEFQAYKIIPHPNFSISGLSNDIAIIRLSTVITFNDYIQPICLWDSNKVALSEVIGNSGIVVGWGVTETSQLSPILRYALMPVVSSLTCLSSNRDFFGHFLSETNFCAGFRNGTSACNGDSGGSLSFEENGIYRIRGIVSLAVSQQVPGLCDSTEYVLFTDVAKYLTWIEEMVPQLKHSVSKSDNCATAPNCGQGDISTNINSNIGLDLSQTEMTSPDHKSCLLPENLPYTIKVYYETASLEIPNSSIIYECKTNYALEGNATKLCVEGQWINDHPKCTKKKFCSPLGISEITITASCELFNVAISCKQPLPPQTMAYIQCAPGYRKTNQTDQYFEDILKCQTNGEWDYHAFRCEESCGEEAPKVVPYIVGGERVNVTRVPWHVGIYSNIQEKTVFRQICGGTIINAKVIISAAHCFWDSAERHTYETENFQVGAAKYYRDFNAMEPIKPQFRNVARIVHKKEYNDFDGYYASDIALLILTDNLKFNSYIKPICLERDLNFNEKPVQPGLIGKLAGWGLETSGGQSRPELKHIDLPAIEYHKCKETLPSKLQRFLTSDKFCAGYTSGQSVCQSDGGGGFVVAKTVRGKKLYFLKGVFSTVGSESGSCDNDSYSLFTNIQFYIEMITYCDGQNDCEGLP